MNQTDRYAIFIKDKSCKKLDNVVLINEIIQELKLKHGSFQKKKIIHGWIKIRAYLGIIL